MISTCLNIIIPGLVLTTVFKNRYNSTSWHINDAVLVTATGFIFNTLLFIALVGLINLGWDQHLLVFGAYTLDICLFSYLLVTCYSQMKAAFRTFVKFMLNPFHLSGFLIVTLYTLYGVMNYPHTLDSGQLKWTFQLIEHLVTSLTTSTGAMGYSALIYYPGVLFQSIPLVTLAAGFKVILGWLFVLTMYYLADKAGFKSKSIIMALLLICFANHAFSEAGLYILGKDSFFAVLFSILFIATLFESEENTSFYLRCGLLLFCSCISGVIVIPFLFIIITLYLLFSATTLKKPFLFIFYLLTISSFALTVAVNAMMHINCTYLAMFFAGVIGVAYAAKNITFANLNLSIFKPVLFPALFAIMFIGLIFLMPIKVPIISWADALNHPVINYYPPLDGDTTFLYYMHSAGHMKKILVTLGLLGILTLVFNKKYRNYKILYAFALFPFCVLYLVIIFAHMKNSPFTGFNLWDMSRDVGNYYFPFVFGLFTLIFIDFSFSLLPATTFLNHSLKKLTYQGSCLMVAIACLNSIHINNYFHLDNVVYTEIGGDKLAIFANLTRLLVLNKYNSGSFLMDKESSGFLYFYSYQMYSNLNFYPVDFKNEESLKAVLVKKPYLIAVDRKNIGMFNQFLKSEKVNIKLLKDYGNDNTILISVS